MNDVTRVIYLATFLCCVLRGDEIAAAAESAEEAVDRMPDWIYD